LLHAQVKALKFKGVLNLWFSFWKVAPLPQGASFALTKLECTCMPYHESCCCKHAYAVALDKGLISAPAEAQQNWFTQRGGHRPQGRPRKMPDARGGDRS
jgi:hypothetical protein